MMERIPAKTKPIKTILEYTDELIRDYEKIALLVELLPKKGMWAILPDGDIELITAVTYGGDIVTTSLIHDEPIDVDKCVLLPSLGRLVRELEKLIGDWFTLLPERDGEWCLYDHRDCGTNSFAPTPEGAVVKTLIAVLSKE